MGVVLGSCLKGLGHLLVKVQVSFRLEHWSSFFVSLAIDEHRSDESAPKLFDFRILRHPNQMDQPHLSFSKQILV